MSPITRKILSTTKLPTILAVRSFVTFDLSEEHAQLQSICRDYSRRHLKPIASRLDREAKFPAAQVADLARLGLLGISIDRRYGGAGFNMLATCVAVEEISRACASTGIIISIHNCLYAQLLQRCGTDEQREQYLRPFVCADNVQIGAFALSEHEAGSDVANLSTDAKPIDGGEAFILSGTKAWVTSSHEASAAIVFATVDRQLKHKGITAFLVPLKGPGADGVSLGRREDKMGIRASSTSDICLDKVYVPRANVVGTIGQGFAIAMTQLQLARVGVAAQALGIAQAALDVAVEYAAQRRMFGQQLIDLQMVKGKIAKMAVELEAARLLTWKAACEHDAGRDYRKISSMAKYAASRCATSNAHRCVQILGGMGYVKEMSAERLYRDARITQIYGGVTEVQQLIIADRVAKEYEEK